VNTLNRKDSSVILGRPYEDKYQGSCSALWLAYHYLASDRFVEVTSAPSVPGLGRQESAGFSVTGHEHVQNIEYFPPLFDFVARCLSFLFFINRLTIDYPLDVRPRAKREQLYCWTSSVAGERWCRAVPSH